MIAVFAPVSFAANRRLVPTLNTEVTAISKQTNMYAYDAYFLDCALREKAPLLTLDRALALVAQGLQIKTIEV